MCRTNIICERQNHQDVIYYYFYHFFTRNDGGERATNSSVSLFDLEGKESTMTGDWKRDEGRGGR